MRVFARSLPCLIVSSIACLSCSGSRNADRPSLGQPFLTVELRAELGVLAQSVVSVRTEFEYEIQSDDGEGGITITRDRQTVSGGGLIIHHDRQTSRYVILTSKHLISPKDTTNIFYLDENGAETNVLFARYIIRELAVSAVGGNNLPERSRMVVTDDRYDLALLDVETQNQLGLEFPNQVGYGENLSWGDWVFLFGFPRGIKQMTGGWVSPSPYPRRLAVAAVVRFGYSGGPIFSVSRESGHLVLAGLLESVPLTALEFVAPGRPLPKGYRLTDWMKSTIGAKVFWCPDRGVHDLQGNLVVTAFKHARPP